MPEQTPEKQAPPTANKRLPIKTMAILAVVLLLEGGAISAAFLLAGGPADVKAEGAAPDAAAQAMQPVEVMVLAEKFQNTRSGRPYLYDTEIFLVTHQKYQKLVEEQIEAMRAQISTQIATIFRRAEPSQLIEPELSTLTRQIRAALDDQLGYDADGNPYVQEVLIKKCMQFRADM